ncbi:hypothetical protein MOQ_005280 [Trypanosoma cruzi marinkellei]|uniref:Uncharacterized protein n=1 Tax=Trypanosoma cruzi marinkellei TaxID=85056 RepID=K2M796_TRYCR|nr:hypothetical protein MOQ_005280 [Trypanosoma cruzi marinkellei]
MMGSEMNPSPRIRVHNAELYTDVMNASDWSRMIEREQQRERIAARRQHEAEEWQLQEQMKLEEVRLQAARETAAAKARQERRAREKRKEQELKDFMCRLAAFMEEHEDFNARCACQARREERHLRRVVEKVHRTWEGNVFLPVQTFIDAQLEDVEGEQHRTLLRHKMLAAFLEECNRTDRVGGRHAVYRDIIDEVRYDPLRQLQFCIVRYPAPQRCEAAVDAQRRAAEAVQRKYAQLAMEYRGLERESTTGILTDPPLHDTSQIPTTNLLMTRNGSTENEFPVASPTRSSDPREVATTAAGIESNATSFMTGGTVHHCTSTVGRTVKRTVLPPLQQPPPSKDPRHLRYGIDINAVDSLAQWTKERRMPRPREADLSVTMWDRFPETMHGWMATADGDVKPSSKRRVDTALKAQHSDVMFDHYNFPRGLEGPFHTGKRVL